MFQTSNQNCEIRLKFILFQDFVNGFQKSFSYYCNKNNTGPYNIIVGHSIFIFTKGYESRYDRTMSLNVLIFFNTILEILNVLNV